MDTRIVFYHSDSGVLPTAAPVPWTKTGADPLQLPASGGVLFEDTSVVDTLNIGINVFASDTPAGPVRSQDTIEVQVRLQGLSCTPGWVSGASGIGIVISDGARVCLVSIGDRLRFCNPGTGAPYYTDSRPFPWLASAVYKFTKRASEAWVLEVNGKVYAEISYLMATALSTPPAFVAVGCFDSGGLASCLIEQPEMGLNLALPPQGLVDRLFTLFPVAVRERWTSLGRGLLRAFVGSFQQGYQASLGAWRDMTSAALPFGLPFFFSGARRPNQESPAWTLTNPGLITLVRERVRMECAGGSANATALFDATLPTVADVEIFVGARLDIWAGLPPTPDAWGRVGPYVQIDDMTRSVSAQLVEDGGSWFWVLTNDTLGGGAVIELGRRWQVGRYVSHTVEVRLFGNAWVVLVVNGHIVDRILYSAFPLSMGPFPFAAIGVTSATGFYDFSDGRAERRLCDLTQRIGLLSRCQERLIAYGGCERNDELEKWKRSTHEVQALRGTTRGMEVEIARLACCGAEVVVEQSLTGWYLDVTWPEVSPIWLDAAGYLSDAFVEFCYGSSNWTPESLAAYIAEYLAPFSVLELSYSICLSTDITGAVVTIPTESLIPVTSAAGFVVGDSVQVRPAAGTSHEDTVITGIAGLNVTVQPPLTGAYGLGDVLRKVLAVT